MKDIRAMVYMWKKHGEESANLFYLGKIDKKHRVLGKKEPSFKQILYGKMSHLGFIKGYNDSTYLNLVAAIQKLDSNYKPPISAKALEVKYITVIGEGKTDSLHISAALTYFHKKEEFLDLNLDFPEKTIKEGWESSIKYCEDLSNTPNISGKHIFVFDRDVTECIKKAADSTGIFKDWGRNVYSLLTPVPDHRPIKDDFCIELYYLDEVLLRKDSDGRRLFLKSEFSATGKHKTEKIYTTSKYKTLVIDQEVFDFDTEKSLAITKSDFASSIFQGKTPFEVINFEPFRSLMELIQQIAHR